ncbi:MAG: enoyl-CoA hydratase/isomerase family protein, partial [Pseudomonadota bacterium]
MAVVDVKRIGDVATIALNNPPVNAMSAALRQALVASIDELEGDPGISAIALHGEGRCFCAGADITEFGGPQSEPLPPDVTMRIEACDTPLAVVLHGTCLGGGLEMGLAAHTRVATPDARLGLPEVGIGLIPGAGGCVRSPHLIGWEAAYDFVTSGRQVSADEALAMGLVDQVRSGDPADLALEAAQDLVKGDLEARKTS